MEQLQLGLLSRLNAPSVVPPHLIKRCRTYREAVQLCWELRQRDITRAQLAEESGLYPPHVTSYLNDKAKSPRDLPGWAVKSVEMSLGNTAISQWHVLNAQLTCVEEMQAMRLVA